MDESSEPYYGKGSVAKRILLRVWFGLAFLAVLVSCILGLVKAKDDAVMYLLVVNLLVSGIIGATIAWWSLKGHIMTHSVMFVLFVGICIIFQAIVSDIYLYHNPNSSSDNGHVKPQVNATTVIPTSTVKLAVQATQTFL